MRSPAPTEIMDITNMLNKRGSLAAQQHFAGEYADQHNQHFALVKPESSMERSASPHGSEHSPYSNSQHMSRRFTSPMSMQLPLHIPNPMTNAMQMPSYADMHSMGNMSGMSMQHIPQQSPPSQQPVKAFACGSCRKGFARRSDLARHERIHSGHRPHSCDEPGCGKQFIQRSALTVHQRVHTGEKPHHCEVCAKPFSDSSSLARHRRTHSGNRPYKCPYADCQKTFTRRTTLTRHQNNHTGTIEEAAVKTEAALAAKEPKVSQARSDGDHMSSQGSPMSSTSSPAQRTMSMSPGIDLSATNAMARQQTGDFHYLQQNAPLPAHLRVGSPTSTSSATYTNAVRPTSHPHGYAPPNTMEPNLEQHQAAPSSNGGSPHLSSPHLSSPHLSSPHLNSSHMANINWQSPSHIHHPPIQHHGGSFVYPDPGDGYPPHPAAMGQMYYGAAPQMRRPQGADHGLVHMA